MCRHASILVCFVFVLRLLFGCDSTGETVSSAREHGNLDDDEANKGDLVEARESEDEGEEDIVAAKDGVCGDFESGAQVIASRVMILLDGSHSMDENGKWDIAVNAINQIVNEYEESIEFGLDVFPSVGGQVCIVNEQAMVQPALNNAERISTRLEGVTERTPATPLFMELMNFTIPNYAPAFFSGTGQRILILVSDGADTCGENTGASAEERLGAEPMDLAIVTGKLLSDLKVRTYAIGFGSDINGNGIEQLVAIAQTGGTNESTFLDATDTSNLITVLDALAEAVAINCRYRLGELDNPLADLDNVNVYLDGEGIHGLKDREQCEEEDGWTWVDDERTTIEFCNAPCNALKSKQIDEVHVQVMCSAELVI